MSDSSEAMAYTITDRFGRLVNSNVAMELLCPGLRDKVRQLAEAMGRREDGRVSPYGDTANVAEDVARAMGCLMRSEEVQRCFTLEGLAEVMVYSRSYGYVGVLIKGDKAS